MKEDWQKHPLTKLEQLRKVLPNPYLHQHLYQVIFYRDEQERREFEAWVKTVGVSVLSESEVKEAIEKWRKLHQEVGANWYSDNPIYKVIKDCTLAWKTKEETFALIEQRILQESEDFKWWLARGYKI